MTTKRLLALAFMLGIQSLDAAPQKLETVIIKSQDGDPKVPSFKGMDTSFLTKKMQGEEIEAYKESIMRLNPGRDPSELFAKRLWDIDYFDKKNLPVVVGELEKHHQFSYQFEGHGLRFLDLPIYMPKQGWRIPPQLEQFKEVIAKVVAFERLINPNFEESYFVYITVDQGSVEPHTAQRRAGWHSDSYRRINTHNTHLKISTDNVYVVADDAPTLFLEGPFSLKGIDPENIEAVLKRFEEIAQGKKPITYPNYTILKLDPYCIHDAGVNQSDKTIDRTFVKISFSEAKYSHLGNAHNQLFVYDWPLVPRHNVPYTKDALAQSSHRKDRDAFLEVNVKEIDFSQPTSEVSWAKSPIQTGYRSSPVKAVRAQAGEVLQTNVDGFLVTINVAQEGDWKVMTSNDDIYFLPDDVFKKVYRKDPDKSDTYLPIKELRRFVKLTENIRFLAPWGTLQYGKKGDLLVERENGDRYIIPRQSFDASHTIVDDNR